MATYMRYKCLLFIEDIVWYTLYIKMVYTDFALSLY